MRRLRYDGAMVITVTLKGVLLRQTRWAGALVAAVSLAVVATPGLAQTSPPIIAKKFGVEFLAGLNETTSLTFTITNPAANAVALTGVAFTDELRENSFGSEVVVATPNGLAGSCGGGAITATAGSRSISLSGATIAAGASCTFSVNVTSVQGGAPPNFNRTSAVTSSNGGTGNVAEDFIVVTLPDLTITKSHDGFFVQGGTGTYTITVSNIASDGPRGLLTFPGPTTGPVTVADTLPPGLTATAMSGTGWTCNLGTLTCTRSDRLNPGGASFPPITLTVAIAATAPTPLINTATVSTLGDRAPSNNTVTDTAVVVSTAVPTLGTWAFLLLALGLALVAVRTLRARRTF